MRHALPVRPFSGTADSRRPSKSRTGPQTAVGPRRRFRPPKFRVADTPDFHGSHRLVIEKKREYVVLFLLRSYSIILNRSL